MDELSAAWSAGLFEGEGCLSVRKPEPDKGTTTYRVALVIRMTDRDTLERMEQLVGGKVSSYVQPGREASHKPVYRWQMNGWDNLQRAFTAWEPWLSMRRREKFQEVLALRGVSLSTCHRNRGRTCSTPDCENPAKAKSLCTKCYSRAYYRREVGAVRS